MRRLSIAILIAFVGTTTQIHAYQLRAATTGVTVRLPSTDPQPQPANLPLGTYQTTTQPSRQPPFQTASLLPRQTELLPAPRPNKTQLETQLETHEFTPRFECHNPWYLQVLPNGLIYQPYMASAHECRLAGQWVKENDWGWLWDVALGGRVGILRYGSDSLSRPEGWQVDMEGAAFPRLQLNHDLDVVSCDYKFGIPFSYGRGRHATRFGYYHLSSHLGDEYLIKYPDTRRINYSRDCLLLGHSIYFHDRKMRVYAEAAWAFQTGDMTKPWEFQFGFEYAPNHATGPRPEPFFAIGGHLREEVNFGGNLIVQTGFLWQGPSGQRFRIGLQYYNGMSDQYEFIDQYENKIGFGIWYDF